MIHLSPKTARERIDFSIDFGPRLEGDTVTGATVRAEGGSISAELKDLTGSVVSFWIAGGQAGQYGTAIVQIQTTAGRTWEELAVILIYA